MDIQKICEELKFNEGTFPETAIKNAVANKESITPELLKVIEYTRCNIDKLVNEHKYFSHIYAFYLLAEFREVKAYPIIVDFFSIPGEITLDITGDLVTDDLSRILASVYDGDDRLLKSLIENKDNNEYVRSAGIKCFELLVALGIKPRDEVILYFKKLFNVKIEKEFSNIWNELVCCSISLYPEELREEIKEAYKNDLVEPFYVNIEMVDDTIEYGKRKTLRDLKENSKNNLISDTSKEMKHWSCFKPENYFKMERKSQPFVNQKKKVGRNDKCSCGSGKKYKKCCLK